MDPIAPRAKRKSIYRELTLGLVVLMSLVSITANLANYLYLSWQAEVLYANKSSGYAAYLTDALEWPLWNVDNELIEKLGDAFTSNTEIGSLIIRDDQDQIVYRKESATGGDLIKHGIIIEHNGNKIGKAEFGLTRKPHDEANLRLLGLSLGNMVLIAIALILATRWLLLRILKKPIDRMIRASGYIVEGKYRPIEEEPSVYEEFSSILAGFKTMSAAVEVRETSLRQANEKLFAEICEREQAQSALERANRAYQALGICAQAVARAASEQELLNKASHIVKEDCGYRLVWIGLVEQDEAKTVRPVAEAGFSDGYLDIVNITWADSERGRGPTGIAIRERRPVFFRDILSDPGFAPWREQALKRGYASCGALPIQAGDHVFGALMVYASETDAFADDEIRLLSELAETIGFGIAKLRSQSEKDAANSANRAKSVFLANMSHELRTPLNAILGFAQLMERDPSLGEHHRRELETINRSGHHLLSLINDVLEISRIEAGRTSIHNEPFDLADTLRAIEDMIRVRAQTKGLAFAIECQGKLPHFVLGDAHRLRQVLINLLGNAVKYTDSGQVTLRLIPSARHGGFPEGEGGQGSREDNIRFEVADTGPGIAPEERERIFQAFYQTAVGIAKGEGTGLGLSISREFVRLMGGELTVDSELGVGSVFAFTLPLPATEAPETAVSRGRVEGLAVGQAPVRILVADDNADSRELIGRLLETVGFEVRAAENGLKAVESFQAWHPQLICMDMRMPEMDGYEATRRIRALPGGGEVKIVALTASAFREDRGAILAAGCDEMVSKPFEEERLFRAIGELLKLEFRYAGIVAPQPSASADSVDFSQLPEALRAELKSAAEMLDLEAAHAIVERMKTGHPEQAQAIGKLLGDFRFDLLMGVLEQHPQQ